MSLSHLPIKCPAWELVFALSELHRECLKTMNFVRYCPIKGIIDRFDSDASCDVRAIFQEASDIRDSGSDRRHFFEIALSLAMLRGLGEQVIEEMLKEPDPGTRIHTPMDLNGSLLRETLSREAAVESRDDVFAIASRCVLKDGTVVQLPMMDFRLSTTEENSKAIATAMRSISPAGGAVIQSKNSYHFYGTSLLNMADWLKFIGKCLLLQGLTDDRYIGHRLREGFCVLRISRGPFHDDVPFVVITW